MKNVLENKPISLMIHDAKENIVKAINDTGLPPSILLLLVKDILSEIISLDAETYQSDLISFKEALDNAVKQEETKDGDTTD